MIGTRKQQATCSRSRVWIMLSVASALVLAGCGGQAAPEPGGSDGAAAEPTTEDGAGEDGGDGADEEVVELRIGFNPFWSLPPLFVGRQLGYFDEIPGVEVTWVEFEDPSAAVAGIAAGDIDAAAGPGPTLLTARGRGVDVVATASLAGESDPAQYGFVAQAGAGLESVADLQGESVGVNNFAGNFDLHLRYLLEEEGLDPETDVDITVTPIPAIIPAVSEGGLAAGAIVGAGVLVAEADESLDLVFTSQDVEPIADGYSFMVMMMSEQFVADHREAAVAFHRAYTRAVEHIEADPEGSAELWATDTGVEIMSQIRTMNEFPDDGHVQVAGLEFDQELLLRYGYLNEPVDVGTAVDSSLLDDALAGSD